MILVDSSIWIDLLRGAPSPQLDLLVARIEREELLMGDLILCEVLRGARNEGEAMRINERLSKLTLVSLGGREVAERAALNYRMLRREGITPRSTIDLLIGTYCIIHGLRLLHRDRDFQPMVRHLGLMEA